MVDAWRQPAATQDTGKSNCGTPAFGKLQAEKPMLFPTRQRAEISNGPIHNIATTARFYGRGVARRDRDHWRVSCPAVARCASGSGIGPPRFMSQQL